MMEAEGTAERGRLKQQLREGTSKVDLMGLCQDDMKGLGLSKEDAQSRNKW